MRLAQRRTWWDTMLKAAGTVTFAYTKNFSIRFMSAL